MNFRQNALVTYIKESRVELLKVTWPTRQEVIQHTLVVVVVSIALAAFLGGLDYGFSKLLELVINKR